MYFIIRIYYFYEPYVLLFPSSIVMIFLCRIAQPLRVTTPTADPFLRWTHRDRERKTRSGADVVFTEIKCVRARVYICGTVNQTTHIPRKTSNVE